MVLPVEAEAAVLGGELLGEARGFGDAGLAQAVELEQQRGVNGQVESRVAVHSVHLAVVHELDAGHGEAELDGFDDRVDRSLDGGEGADGHADRFGQRVQAKRDLRDDAQRAFGADKEAGEVVAGARFARAGAGVDDASVGQHHGEAEDVFAHRAVTNRRGAGGARRGHAADGGVGAGIDEEGQAGVVEGLDQLRGG